MSLPEVWDNVQTYQRLSDLCSHCQPHPHCSGVYYQMRSDSLNVPAVLLLVLLKMQFIYSGTHSSFSFLVHCSSEPQLRPVGMVLEGSSEALCPPPSLELRPSCNKSQTSPPLGTSSQPHDGVFPEEKEPIKYGELIVLGWGIKTFHYLYISKACVD